MIRLQRVIRGLDSSILSTEDRISDLPSSGEFALMESLGAEFRPMVFPQLRGPWLLPLDDILQEG